MSTEVPGQLFGYTLQFPRAYLRLLEIPSDASVSIEESSDVAAIFSDGSKLVEEDKSSTRNINPVQDKSINLWKTFYNWINKINGGILNIERDRFILYVNHSVPDNALVKLFSNADKTNIDKIIKIIENIKSSIEPTHPIYKYIKYLLQGKNLELFKNLVLNRFDFICNKKSDDVYSNIRKKLKHDLCLDSDNDIEMILHNATGWLQKEIMTKIAKHEPPVICRRDYEKFIRPFIKKINDTGLIDYANLKNLRLSKDKKTTILKERPIYVKQLEFIEMDTDLILSAIDDYYKAEINRGYFIEEGILTKKDIQDFKDELMHAYSNEKMRIDITHSSDTNINKGRLLYTNCQDKSILLVQKEPPSRTVQGTYQLLADEQKLGWHPYWKIKLESD